MIGEIYRWLNSLFGGYISNHPLLSITIAGIIVGIFFTLISYLVTDVEKIKKIQKMSRELQKELAEARKSGDEKKLKKLQQKQMELLKLQNEVMKPQTISMILTIPIFWIFFGWLGMWYKDVAIVTMPKSFFVLTWINGFFHSWGHSPLPPFQMGYVGWYFLTVTVVGMILRKLLDMG